MCGIAFTDELLSSDQVQDLKQLAIKAIDKIGETTNRNRESHTLQWVNIHNIFRKLPYYNMLSDKEFRLLEHTSAMAKVSKRINIAQSKPGKCVFKSDEGITWRGDK